MRERNGRSRAARDSSLIGTETRTIAKPDVIPGPFLIIGKEPGIRPVRFRISRAIARRFARPLFLGQNARTPD